MLDPARNPPKSYRCSMAFLIVHNSVIIWHKGKMGEKEKAGGGFWQKSGKLSISRWSFLLGVAPQTTCSFLHDFNLSQTSIFQTSSQMNA